MFNLTAGNYTEPILPGNPLTYLEEYNYKLLLWMTPLLVSTIWVNMYILFRWFKFTLKPPYTVAIGNFFSAIWDTSH